MVFLMGAAGESWYVYAKGWDETHHTSDEWQTANGEGGTPPSGDLHESVGGFLAAYETVEFTCEFN